MLSGINSLKSVRFFKLVLRYDYSIVIYIFLAYWHTQCNVRPKTLISFEARKLFIKNLIG